MKISNIAAILISCNMLCGCISGGATYTKPEQVNNNKTNTVVINKSKEIVWKELIPALGKQFYVINNLDKDSGLINVSYSGDPEKYIDCGKIDSKVSDMNGDRNYSFSGAKAYERYEVVEGINLFIIDRKMALEGRVNLIVQELPQNQSQISANTKYVVSKTFTSKDSRGFTHSVTDTVTFNTGQGSTFPNSPVECYSTGELEATILGLLNGK